LSEGHSWILLIQRPIQKEINVMKKRAVFDALTVVTAFAVLVFVAQGPQ